MLKENVFRAHRGSYRGEKIPRTFYGRVGYVAISPPDAILRTSGKLRSPGKGRDRGTPSDYMSLTNHLVRCHAGKFKQTPTV